MFGLSCLAFFMLIAFSEGQFGGMFGGFNYSPMLNSYRTLYRAPGYSTGSNNDAATNTQTQPSQAPVLRQIQIQLPRLNSAASSTTHPKPQSVQIFRIPARNSHSRSSMTSLGSDSLENILDRAAHTSIAGKVASESIDKIDDSLSRTTSRLNDVATRMDLGVNSLVSGIRNQWGMGGLGLGGLGGGLGGLGGALGGPLGGLGRMGAAMAAGGLGGMGAAMAVGGLDSDAWDARSDMLGDRWDTASDMVDGRYDHVSDQMDSYGDYASDMYDTLSDSYDYS